MIITKFVEVSVRPNNKDYLLSKGYTIDKDKCLILVEDLQPYSRVEVLAQCDVCGVTKKIFYYNYYKSISKNSIYACQGKCSNVKKKMTNLVKYGSEWASTNVEVKERITQTNLKKYGVSNGRTNEKTDLIKSKNREKWGVDYYSQTDEAKEKVKLSNINKWGVEYPQLLDSVKNKIKESNISRFGVDNPMKSEYVRKKVRQTKLQNWGDENYNNRDKFLQTMLSKWGMFYTQTEDYRMKSKMTSLENWGYEFPIQSELVKEKVKKTKFERFGDPYYNNLEKAKTTNLNKWGSEFALSNEEIRKKIYQTNLIKYGVENIIELDNVKKKRIESYNSRNREYVLETYRKILPDSYEIIDYIDNMFIVKHNDHQFTSTLKLVYDRMRLSESAEICTICNPLNSNSSCHEKELGDWLAEVTDIEYRNRKILNGFELDIFIPENKLAIEFNGLYWHSELHKKKNYHIDKTNKCKQLGFDLIHIFEDDWINKKEIVKSILKNRIGITDRKVYARKCDLRVISTREAKKFLDQNHIQGYSRCKYKIGLFLHDELVSVMTFGKRYTNAKPEFELIRFCNKLNYNVLGGASKLLNFFINQFSWSGTIVSYADISIFSGGLYEKLGFVKKHITKPNYFWVVDGKREHRFKYNKKNLMRFYETSDSSKTEKEMMYDLGYYRIWSCGHIRYEMTL